MENKINYEHLLRDEVQLARAQLEQLHRVALLDSTGRDWIRQLHNSLVRLEHHVEHMPGSRRTGRQSASTVGPAGTPTSN